MPPSALTIPQKLVSQVLERRPNLSISSLDSSTVTQHPGRTLDLVDSQGDFLARGVADPENDLVRIWTWEEFERLDDAFLARQARQALNWRKQIGLIGQNRVVDSAFRLVHGEGDGVSGITQEALGPYIVQYVYSKGLREWGSRFAEAIADQATKMGLKTEDGKPWPQGILQKVRSRDAAKPGKPTQSVVFGEEPPQKYLVKENGVPFEVHPIAGLNVGLFTDLREHRWRLPRFCHGAEVLNTFAYTGSLSVVAALSGAKRVTSVDLSSGVLKWARANFEHAGLDPEEHRFEASDVGRFLKRALEEGEQYDLIIVDPPTYSAARAASWSMKKDLGQLFRDAVALLAPSGVLFMASNRHQLSAVEFDRQLADALVGLDRKLRLVEKGGLGPDCPTCPQSPEMEYLKVRIFKAVD